MSSREADITRNFNLNQAGVVAEYESLMPADPATSLEFKLFDVKIPRTERYLGLSYIADSDFSDRENLGNEWLEESSEFSQEPMCPQHQNASSLRNLLYRCKSTGGTEFEQKKE